MYFMESFEYHGYWRLPNQTTTIAGTLKFSPTQGGTLELLGSFEEFGGISNPIAAKHEIIHGYTPDGKFITLYKCINIHTSFSQPGYFTTKFYVNVIFVGIFFDNLQEITFKKISINFLNLDEWLGLNFLNYKQSKSKKEHILKYKIPAIKKFTIDNMFLTIDFNLNISTTQTRGTMQQTPYLKLEYDSEKHFDEFYKRIFELQNFLTFLMNSATYPIKVLGYNKKMKLQYRTKPFIQRFIFSTVLIHLRSKNLIPILFYLIMPRFQENLKP